MTEEEIRKIINKLPDPASFQETYDYILEKLGKSTSFEEVLFLTHTFNGLPKRAIDEAINNIRFCNGEKTEAEEDLFIDKRDHFSLLPSFCSPITLKPDDAKKNEIKRIKSSASFDFDKIVREQLDKLNKNFYKGE